MSLPCPGSAKLRCYRWLVEGSGAPVPTSASASGEHYPRLRQRGRSCGKQSHAGHAVAERVVAEVQGSRCGAWGRSSAWGRRSGDVMQGSARHLVVGRHSQGGRCVYSRTCRIQYSSCSQMFSIAHCFISHRQPCCWLHARGSPH